MFNLFGLDRQSDYGSFDYIQNEINFINPNYVIVNLNIRKKKMLTQQQTNALIILKQAAILGNFNFPPEVIKFISKCTHLDWLPMAYWIYIQKLLEQVK